jgi:hypothetical protein
MTFPDRFIRGISDNNSIAADGVVSNSAIQFKETIREDGFSEASINWYDDENALQLIMEQRKEDQTYQFKAGAIIIDRSEADRIIEAPVYKTLFSYERLPIEGNVYHGNLLCKGNAAKGMRQIIVSNLILKSQFVPRKAEYND